MKIYSIKLFGELFKHYNAKMEKKVVKYAKQSTRTLRGAQREKLAFVLFRFKAGPTLRSTQFCLPVTT